MELTWFQDPFVPISIKRTELEPGTTRSGEEYFVPCRVGARPITANLLAEGGGGRADAVLGLCGPHVGSQGRPGKNTMARSGASEPTMQGNGYHRDSSRSKSPYITSLLISVPSSAPSSTWNIQDGTSLVPGSTSIPSIWIGKSGTWNCRDRISEKETRRQPSNRFPAGENLLMIAFGTPQGGCPAVRGPIMVPASGIGRSLCRCRIAVSVPRPSE